MEYNIKLDCTAFQGERCIGSGQVDRIVRQVVSTIDGDDYGSLMIFNDANGEPIEIDYRGSADDILARLSAYLEKSGDSQDHDTEITIKKPGPGRPKLGVVAREVTLLPRHWDWLNRQPGGASVTLRKLVEQARKAYRKKDTARLAREAAYRFITIMAGNRSGFEETSRALFSGNREQYKKHMASWPEGIQQYAGKLAEPSFQVQAPKAD